MNLYLNKKLDRSKMKRIMRRKTKSILLISCLEALPMVVVSFVACDETRRDEFLKYQVHVFAVKETYHGDPYGTTPRDEARKKGCWGHVYGNEVIFNK